MSEREWQPIETAPRDGTPVLLFLPDVDRGRPGCEVAQWWGDCWWTNGGPNAGDDIEAWSSATHWQPLPSHPSNQNSRSDMSESEPLRCIVTGNPCGTDTVAEDYECGCLNCQRYYDTRPKFPVGKTRVVRVVRPKPIPQVER